MPYRPTFQNIHQRPAFYRLGCRQPEHIHERGEQIDMFHHSVSLHTRFDDARIVKNQGYSDRLIKESELGPYSMVVEHLTVVSCVYDERIVTKSQSVQRIDSVR